MAGPIVPPNVFASQAGPIPLAQLDSNLNYLAATMLDSLTALRATTPKTASSGPPRVWLTGATAPNYGILYWYNSADTTSADNGTTIIVAADGGRWYAASNQIFGIADVSSYASPQAAINSGAAILRWRGTITITAALVPVSGQTWILEPGCIIQFAQSNNASPFNMIQAGTAASPVTLTDFWITGEGIFQGNRTFQTTETAGQSFFFYGVGVFSRCGVVKGSKIQVNNFGTNAGNQGGGVIMDGSSSLTGAFNDIEWGGAMFGTNNNVPGIYMNTNSGGPAYNIRFCSDLRFNGTAIGSGSVQNCIFVIGGNGGDGSSTPFSATGNEVYGLVIEKGLHFDITGKVDACIELWGCVEPDVGDQEYLVRGAGTSITEGILIRDGVSDGTLGHHNVVTKNGGTATASAVLLRLANPGTAGVGTQTSLSISASGDGVTGQILQIDSGSQHINAELRNAINGAATVTEAFRVVNASDISIVLKNVSNIGYVGIFGQSGADTLRRVVVDCTASNIDNCGGTSDALFSTLSAGIDAQNIIIRKPNITNPKALTLYVVNPDFAAGTNNILDPGSIPSTLTLINSSHRGKMVSLQMVGTVAQGSLAFGGNGQFSLQAISVPGADLGDTVVLSTNVDQQHVFFQGYVSAADTVNGMALNQTGGAVTVAASTLKAVVTKNYALI